MKQLKPLKTPTSPKQKYDLTCAIYLARLTNKELMLLRLWMEGFTHKDIKFILGLKVSQPYISKQISSIRERVKASYLHLNGYKKDCKTYCT